MKVVYIAYQYPTLTQTFIQREVRALARAGVSVEVHAMRKKRPPAGFQMPEGTSLFTFSFLTIFSILWRFPIEFLRSPGLWIRGLKVFLKGTWRGSENAWINLLGFVFAVVKAADFRQKGVTHFHGVWATGMTTAACLLARMNQGTFSMGAHAFDVYRNGGDAFLQEKLKRAAFVHTTTQANIHYLKNLCSSARMVLSRRGLESLPESHQKSEKKPGDPFRILAVARLVSKKGLEHQLKICGELKKRGFFFEHQIIGDGPLRKDLENKIKEFSIEKEVVLRGALAPSEVQKSYAQTDLFWHSGLVDMQGDRDGLPNVIPEAMAWKIPVLSSPTPGADEAVIHGETGWIVDPQKTLEATEAILKLAGDPLLGSKLGEGGREWVKNHFMSDQNIEILVKEFRLLSGPFFSTMTSL